MIRRAARLSATSLATRELLERIAPGVPIDMVYAGVPDDLFTLPRRPEEWLLYFGRLDVFQKGLDTLLDAFVRGHLERYADGLKEGAPISRGQLLGYVGTSGNAPPNTPHLHFAIYRTSDPKRWWEGTPIDPFLVLR